MSILTRRRPPAATAEPVYSQHDLRVRRRARLSVVYTGAFDLSAEVAAIVDPLAARITAVSRDQYRGRGLPLALVERVGDLVDATHGELVSGVVGWLAELDARQRTEHMAAESSTRADAIRLLVDLKPRPRAPELGPEDLASGRWATALVDMAEHYTAPLSDLLARARRPGDPVLRGAVSRSERLCDLLRDVDSAARQLELVVDKAERSTPSPPRPPNEPATRAEATRAQLRALGIEIEP